ncbi:MAG: DUF2953 domain-containing protein [Lachnospiraceae bacterium]|nr:DUF2953 domain-containing protein [Lachnospiraceae bacterium]
MTALAVILTVLKILGIVLLCVLGLVLVIALIVLFCPVRYEIHADIREPGQPDPGIGERTEATARVSWLFRLIRATFMWPFPEDGPLSVYIAFFRLFPRKSGEKKEKHAKRRGRDGETENDADGEGTGDEGFSSGEAAEKKEEIPGREDPAGQEGIRDRETAAEDDRTDGTEGRAETDNRLGEAEDSEDQGTEGNEGPLGSEDAAEANAGSPGKRKRPLRERIGDLRQKLTDASEKPQIAAKKIYYTISCTCDKIKKICVTVESETFARAKQVLLKEVMRVLRHSVPRKCRVDLVYGAADPASTGNVMAAVGMLYPVLGDRVRVVPVFDGETLYGTAHVRGRLVPAVFAFSFLRCYFNRDVRRIVKRAKRIKEERRNDGG